MPILCNILYDCKWEVHTHKYMLCSVSIGDSGAPISSLISVASTTPFSFIPLCPSL